ncbi:MAG: mechanosensitive ion channel family protein [Mesorhizobium sp.]|nr:MAG: mechanosensitive ion channel family protein [Mesorhizobium sp.]
MAEQLCPDFNCQVIVSETQRQNSKPGERVTLGTVSVKYPPIPFNGACIVSRAAAWPAISILRLMLPLPGIVIRAKFTAKPGKQSAIRRAAPKAVHNAFRENGIQAVPKPTSDQRARAIA